MESYNLIPPEKLGEGSSIKLDVSIAEVDIYWKVAIEVLTVMVVPYGSLGSYFRMTELINKYRISLKNCVFINMDEYLTDEKKYLDKSDPLSFRDGMDRIFYNVVDEELNVLPENRIFPDPEHPEKVLEIIEKYGKPDMVFGGVGINGHCAFNEPPEPDEEYTNEAFAKRFHFLFLRLFPKRKRNAKTFFLCCLIASGCNGNIYNTRAHGVKVNDFFVVLSAEFFPAKNFTHFCVKLFIREETVPPHQCNRADHSMLNILPIIYHNLTRPAHAIVINLIVRHIHNQAAFF